jgi:hypothetical protein
MNYGQTDKAREIQIEVAAGSASTGGKRGESTIEERILSTDSPRFLVDGITQEETYRSGSLLSDHVPIVLNVVGQLMFFDGLKACAREIFARFFFAPHRSQPLTTLRQRYGHAMHAGDRIKERAQRVIGVPMMRA